MGKPAHNRIPRQDLLAEIVRLNKELNRVPTLEDVKKYCKYSEDPFYFTFGSWTAALRTVGLIPSRIGIPLLEEELLDDLRRVDSLVDGRPRAKDYMNLGKYTISRYHYHYGGWAKALEKIGYSILPDPDWSIDQVSDADGYWLSGLVDGEGCFITSRYNRDYGRHTFVCSFAIGFRIDDYKTLELIKLIWDLDNNLYRYKRNSEKGQDAINLNIQGTLILARKIVPTFEKYPLRTKKARDFDLWKEAVKIKFNKLASGREYQAYTPDEMHRMNELYKKMKEIKIFQEPNFKKR